jgi:hypothetical protein
MDGPLNILAAAASVVSSVAIIAAALFAARQVRVAASHVEHVRRTTQLEGTMKVFEMLGTHEQVRSRIFIRHTLAEQVKDDTFRALIPLGREDAKVHKEWPTLSLMEMIGTYVKHGLLDGDILFDYCGRQIIEAWQQLVVCGVIEAFRESGGPMAWENFEYLYGRAQDWQRVHASARADVQAGVQNEVVADAPAT